MINLHNLKNKVGLSIVSVLLFVQTAAAKTDFSIWTMIGDPTQTWGQLDGATKNLILFITGLAFLALLLAGALGMIGHSIDGAAGEKMDQHGSKSNAFKGQVKTALYVVSAIFFIGLIGLVFKLFVQ